VKVGGLLGIGKVERVELEEEGHSCPRCTAPVTVAQLRELFPKAEEDTLKTVAYTYTKYMKELQMDTCWNKAHFFAQAAIETGFKLHIKNGENMNYKSEEDLYKKFPSRFFKGKMVNNEFVPLVDPKAEFRDKNNWVFKSKELSQKASELIKSTPRDQNIANFVYGNRYGNGNEASGDGWRFRGSGLIQLTYKDNFKMVNNKIEKLWGKSILTDSGAEEVRKELELAVLTSMGYFAAKGANKKANGANSDQQIKEVCKLIGRNTKFGKSKNHEEKTIFFKNKSSKTFKTNECLWGHSKGKAPWMPFAISEIGQKAIAGKENNPRINDYFNASSNGKGWDEQNDWCGAFASWVFAQAGYTPPPLSCRAAMWQFWKQLDRPIYGAAAVIDWGENDLAESNGSHIGGRGHITFVVGESSDGKYYYCLGGNQGGVEGARMVKISKFEKSEIDWFVIPPSYEPTKEEYNLKIMADEADIDDESTTRSN
jgi:chitinase-like protein